MQLRSGKTITMSTNSVNTTSVLTTPDNSEWFKQYCIKMIKLLNQNKMEFTEDIMNAHDFIMEQLRVIDELFYNIVLYVPIVNINPKVYNSLYERSVQLEKFIKKMVIRSFWKKEDEWSVEDVQYAKNVTSTIKNAQQLLFEVMI